MMYLIDSFAPGVPFQSCADVSRSPPDRSMLLRLSTQKSSQPEVRAQCTHCGVRPYGQGAILMYANAEAYNRSLMELHSEVSSAAALSVHYLKSGYRGTLPAPFSSGSWKAGGLLVEPDCCGWSLAVTVSKLQPFVVCCSNLLVGATAWPSV